MYWSKFLQKKNKLKLKIVNNKIVENQRNIVRKDSKFGESIHYCNLRINNIEINKFLRKINKNIYGLGMSFINQSVPGPISNEIILDAKVKCKKMIK